MNEFVRKLSSRKFWAAVVNFVTQLLIAFNVAESTVTQVAAIIMAGAGVLAYIIGEGLIDAARVNGNDIYYELNPNETITGDTSLIGTQDPEMGDE